MVRFCLLKPRDSLPLPMDTYRIAAVRGTRGTLSLSSCIKHCPFISGLGELHFSYALCSIIPLCPTLCNSQTVVHQAPPLTMGFSRQEYWSTSSRPSDQTHIFYICLHWQAREGNGTPLQYSCLENPWTEEPGRLQSVGSLRVGHD